jgi:hypothetical protein
MVGLIPLFAVETLDSTVIDKLPGFKRRLQWFMENRPALSDHLETQTTADGRVLRFLSLVNRHRLRHVLRYMLDEREFLSPYGVRALSRVHLEQPYTLALDGMVHRVTYEPAESSTSLFGGNSNWRGPVWFPVNYLLIESLQKFHYYLGDNYKIECPTGSQQPATLGEISKTPIRVGQSMAARSSSNLTRIGKTSCSSTSTFTATTARASARVIKPAGPGWWRNCSNRAENRKAEAGSSLRGLADTPSPPGTSTRSVKRARASLVGKSEILRTRRVITPGFVSSPVFP